MKRIALAALVWLAGYAAAAGETVLVAETHPRQSGIVRYGINLGGPSAWGAEQLLANILANPGFEPVIERSIVIVDSASGKVFSERDPWVRRPDGFWTGASGKVLTGAASGQRFSVIGHDRDGMRTQRQLVGLAPGDVLALSVDSHDSGAPARWWSDGYVRLLPSSGKHSKGSRFVRLAAAPDRPARLASYMDTLERAGRLLPVTGAWRLSFSARATGPGPARIRVRFAREGEQVFIDRTITPGSDWSRVSWDFTGNESAAGKGPLALSFTVESGSVDLDDAYLGERDPGPGGFRQAVVATLAGLRPGYLRDWQGQLGDTVDNRTTDPKARRPIRYRNGDAEILHTYGVLQAVELAASIGASPWLILPTTFTPDEAEELGRRVRVAVDRLKVPEIVLEFGNENWNPLFRPGGIIDPHHHGEAASRALAAFRRGFGKGVPLLSAVNARSGDAAGEAALAAVAPDAERIAIAPYFAYAPAPGGTLESAIVAVFGDAAAFPKRSGNLRRASASEVNLHATAGPADATRRDTLVAGAASGPALAVRLIAGTLAGLREQAVYSLAGYDTFSENGEPVRLFGVVRDLGTAGRWRPTGLALAMLNRIAMGDALAARCAGDGCSHLTAIAFASAGRHAWAVVNGSPAPRRLRLSGACTGGPPAGALLDGSQPGRTNEDAVQVAIGQPAIACAGADAVLVIPGFSLVTVSTAAKS